MSLPVGYALHVGVPFVSTYLHLRETAGLSVRTPEQAIAALQGSWAACYVVRTEATSTASDAPSSSSLLSSASTAPKPPDPEIVAMGRVLGDGGWYFVVADMAVHPLHQRRGLGDVMLKHLLWEITARAPPQPYVCLSADAAGRRLYARNGFVETAPQSVGMVWRPE
ncbi:GNAT family N-acetyltransferase [Aspergillus affinis]|uniref:GNAT family N-acetyltransferase n=1 Tax=Aspergillus affinis TaxID=1070780 RepID=UPI0022FEA16B|nr:Acyl-CoA N-acyltransferase [Aspergillus affinis]KAI9041094.1 Acyl-CoA N-acyltransferase [Aspergillus affinis]